MKKLRFSIVLLLVTAMITSPVSLKANTQNSKSYPSNDTNITYFGRTVEDEAEDVTYFNWTCSGFQFHFEGNKIDATIKTSLVGTLYPYIAVFVDNFDEPYKIIKLEKEIDTYTLFESKDNGTHNIKIVKRTEALHSKTALVSLTAHGKNASVSSLPITKTRNLEFVGDSFTCGYGNESNNPADGFRTEQENGWETFAAKTARKLDANFNCVSISGIGIISNWTPEDKINSLLLMPEIYEYQDIYLDLMKNQPRTPWEFNRYKTDVVVIGLGLNDLSYMRYDFKNRFEQFKNEYIELIKTVREKNGPDTKILCLNFFIELYLQSNGVTTDKNLMEDIVTSYKQQTNDTNVDFYDMVPPKPEDGIGGSWHPTIKTHERMSEGLTIKLRNWLNW